MQKLASTFVLFSLAVTACTKGEAKPEPAPKPVADSPLPTTAPVAKPAASPVKVPATKASGMQIMRAIASKKLAISDFDLNRKWVSVDLMDGRHKVTAFCGDNELKTFNQLPAKIVAQYAARIASSIADGDGGVVCTEGKPQIRCELHARDEHEPAVTFLIVGEAWGPVLTGVAMRETWMIDPDSPRLAKDEKERDVAFALATTDDCFTPESARGRAQD